MSLPIVIPRHSNLSAWAAAVNREIHSLKNAPAEIADVQTHPLALGMPVTYSRSASFSIGDTMIVKSGSSDLPSSMSANFPTLWVCEANVPDVFYSDYIKANPGTFDTASFIAYIRQPGINYEPQYPEPTASATLDNPNGRYWRAVGSSGDGTSFMMWDYYTAIPKNTFVCVDPNLSYPLSFFDTGSVNTPPLGAGIYITLHDVPDSSSRDSGNLYYPFAPPYWDDSAEVTISGSVKNRLYYRWIAPLNPLDICSNGETTKAWVSFIVTGSYSFSLPYP